MLNNSGRFFNMDGIRRFYLINIQTNSDKLMIVVHEIYGINQHMKDVCATLSQWGFNVICPNLLEKETPFDYSSEEDAYQHFMKHIGLLNGANTIKSVLREVKDRYKEIFIVGFSVGATVAWVCSEEEGINGVVCYYGSRIRNHLEIEPICPTMLFFPETEKSFDVDELIASIEKTNPNIHKLKGKHGFTDPYNSNYHVQSTQETFHMTMNFLLQH